MSTTIPYTKSRKYLDATHSILRLPRAVAEAELRRRIGKEREEVMIVRSRGSGVRVASLQGQAGEAGHGDVGWIRQGASTDATNWGNKCGGYALGVENVYELCTTCHNLRVANIMINK